MQRTEVDSARGRPASTEHAAYYGKYIALVPDEDIVSQLKSQRDDTMTYLRTIPESKATILHPPYTWTIKQVIGHLCDGERIFGYRALRIARGDTTSLPGFDENDYARAPEFSQLGLRQLVDEFDAVRRASIALFEDLSQDSWTRLGNANNYPVSVRAIAYIMVGHTIHHMNIIRKRLGAAQLQHA